jgi:carbon-monoxide dehydrogenase large subunit
LIGAPLRRREDARVLRGETRYLDDIELPGMAHAAFVRSPFAHARITSIARPPAVTVLTGADLAVRRFPVSAVDGTEVAPEGHPVLAGEAVMYVGEPVALVLADSRALAEDAAELVEVEYDELEPVIDPHASETTLTRWARATGDVDGAFATAAHVIRGCYALPRLAAVAIEPRGAIASWDAGSEQLTLWCSAQDPHRPRSQLTHILDRSDDAIRVIVPDVGGAFGSKGVIAPEVAALAAAAIDLGRPLKWTEDRYENLLACYQGRGIEGELELALDGSGRMLALRGRLLADLGGYLLTTTAIPPHTAAMLLTGCYEIPAAEVTVTGVRTNKPPTGPYRGAGRPDAAYMLECLLDDGARELGLDRIELRRRNLIRRFPHRTPMGHVYDSGDYERCLDTALELLGDAGADPDGLAGTGIALYVERSGGEWEAAEIELGGSGQVTVRSSCSPHGQGHETTFAQIAADRLGIAIERIALCFGDSAVVPRGVGTYGSRSVAIGGSAVAVAAEQLIERARPLAARLLDGEPEWADGAFTARGRRVTLAELARREGGLSASATFRSPPVFSSGAYGAHVEIDRATGRLHVRSIVAVDDAGTVINPLLAHGQVIGGVVQGLGECLVEEARFDEAGQALSASLMHYSLLTAADVPPILTAEVASPSPLNPLGAKGVGEGGAIGTLPAIANAVADALSGIRLDPPFDDERLWRALR